MTVRGGVSCFCLVLALIGPTALFAQTLDVGSLGEEYLRLLQLSGDAPLGSMSVRPVVLRADARQPDSGTAPWRYPFRLDGGEIEAAIDPIRTRLRIFANSDHPIAFNDGAVWQGKGITSAFEVGTSFAWKGLRMTARPQLILTQNAAFDLGTVLITGQPEYAYPWRRIDLPQRFGPDGFARIDAGESEIRLSGRGVTGGVSNRTRWWGPGIDNAIIMSNNAGGIPHLFLGTRGPRDIGIGTVEALWMWGWLKDSDYFDPALAREDGRYLTGLVASYAPSFLEGLSVGLTRVFYGYVPEEGVGVSDYFLVLQGVRKDNFSNPGNPAGDDEVDQMLSFFARWVLPESGFEVYGEWARNDHAWNLTDFILEPEHSQGYTLGLQKAISLSGQRRLTVRTELTHLEREPTFQTRPNPPYYSHHIVHHGYTHRGEVIGAGIGPGGIQQTLAADVYTSWGRAGGIFRRRVRDNDAYYAGAVLPGSDYDNHDVSFDFGGNVVVFRGDVTLEGRLMYTHEFNRYFNGPRANNFNVQLSAQWAPGT